MPEFAAGVDRDPDKQGGEPCVARTRVPVRRVGRLVEQHGRTPAEAAAHYELSVSDVHRALAYYHDHPEEMARYDRRDGELEHKSRADDVETFKSARNRLRGDS